MSGYTSFFTKKGVLMGMIIVIFIKLITVLFLNMVIKSFIMKEIQRCYDFDIHPVNPCVIVSGNLFFDGVQVK